jgi:acyl-CoA reductase-like NAD-dependent aldehyde dehydrogenase
MEEDPVRQASLIVAKAGERVRENMDRFAKYATVDMGKFINEFRGEVTITHQEI